MKERMPETAAAETAQAGAEAMHTVGSTAQAGAEAMLAVDGTAQAEEPEKTLEAVRAYFAADRFATENGAVIEEFGEGYALCSLQVEARHRNAIGAVMGGVLFTLADFAFAVAANWKQVGTVSVHGDIAFLSGVRGKRLLAEARCIRAGRSSCFYQVDVRDELGTHVARVSVTGFTKA